MVLHLLIIFLLFIIYCYVYIIFLLSIYFFNSYLKLLYKDFLKSFYRDWKGKFDSISQLRILGINRFKQLYRFNKKQNYPEIWMQAKSTVLLKLFAIWDYFLSQIANVIFHQTSSTHLSEVFSATPWCWALVTAASSPPPCLLYPGTGSLRKDRKCLFDFHSVFILKWLIFNCSHPQWFLSETSKLQLIQDNQNWTSPRWIPTIPNTLRLCIK